ncbi:MAG: amino acid permease [Candidatus Nanohaloarchaeota archaeon]|nr:amino acid permease [Candidatus Nanohaloarchaeota archaeon]
MKNKTKDKKLSLWEAVSLAVGTMIGASIFTLLSTGIEIAGYYLPLSLLLSGILALMVAYSYSHLGKKIISNAGPVAFILKGFGDNIIVGVVSFLMWFVYVVSLALFAKGFAYYFCPLLGITSYTLVEISIIVFFTILNFFGSKFVGILEKYMVAIKVGVLLFFIVVGSITLKQIHFVQTNPSNILLAVMMFFLSYIGFGLVTNASENIQNPEKNIPHAIYLSILILIMIYVGVAFVAVQHLNSFSNLNENILAEIMKPILGEVGYLLVSIGAILSTLSALNATLYGGVNIAYSLAKKGELPKIFERKIWFNEPEGLYITAFLAILFLLFFNLEAIASIISLVFFIIYLLVLLAHYKLIKKQQVSGNAYIVLFNLMALIAVFVSFLYYTYLNKPKTFLTFIIVVSIATIIEFIIKYKNIRNFKKYLSRIEKR